ncbi:MAG: hypothetical protein HOO06_00700 [Bdellovibrionaceae bacterium]|jgi:spoIIIJ-associated protein|nr:hypothetical protein [Pseudobdellovibrionaceae bacterium]
MGGLLSKLFGKKSSESSTEFDDLVEGLVVGVIEKSNLSLSYEINFDDDANSVEIELFGEDEGLLKSRDGQLLDAIQLLITRVIQHKFESIRASVIVDSSGFRKEAVDALVSLAEKLKGIALKKKKSVYFRALPPRDRKVIHQYLADDERIKSHSVGDGLYKKIKIYPIRQNNEELVAAE